MSRRATAAFLVLLTLFVVVRGLGLGSALMPFEGWDEYQHLAVGEYVVNHGTMPVIPETMDASLVPFLQAHPHPEHGADQLRSIGAPRYRGLVAPEPDFPPRLPELYQAQHGPAFYWLLAGTRRLVGDRLAWADLARTINVVLLALTGVLWFGILARAFPRFPALPFAAALVWSSGSLWVFNAARVANDTLAIFLGSLALFAFVVWRGGARNAGWLLGVGALLGAGAITKSTIVALAPVVAITAAFSMRGWRPMLTAALAVTVGYAVIAGYYHYTCLDRYKTITGMREAVYNLHTKGITTQHAIEIMPRLPHRAMANKFLLDAVHVGGWSFRPPPAFAHRAHGWLLVLAGVALVVACALRRGALGALGRNAWLLALVAAVWAGMYYHAAHSALYHGTIYTNAWYGAIVFPIVAAVSVLGAVALAPRLGALVAIAWSAVLSSAFVVGVYTDLLPFQTGEASITEAAAAVAAHHAFLVLPPWPVLGAQALLWLVLVVFVWRAATPTSAAPPGDRSARAVPPSSP